jgi:hypothetical protein
MFGIHDFSVFLAICILLNPTLGGVVCFPGRASGGNAVKESWRLLSVGHWLTAFGSVMIQILFRAVMMGVVCSSLAGCFVRLPCRGTPAEQKRVGATVLTKKDFLVYTCLDGNVAIAPERERWDVGPAQRKLGMVPKGSVVKFRWMVFRILPWGNADLYVCRAPQQKLTFDIIADQADSFVDWTQGPNEPVDKTPPRRP